MNYQNKNHLLKQRNGPACTLCMNRPDKHNFLTGRAYESRDCLRMGLLNDLVSPDALKPSVEKLAAEIAENAPLALRGTKRALYKMAEKSPLSQDELSELAALFDQSLKSEDLKEGQRAFKEKRKPLFKGR